MRGWIAGCFLCVVSLTGWCQEDEAARANALYQEGKRPEALPLYEHLAQLHPDQMLYFHRLADCLGAMSIQTSDLAQVKAYRTRERDAARRAVELGDTAEYIKLMADIDPDASVQIAPQSAGGAFIQEGEKAFTAGDYKTAMEKYVAAAEADPHLYEAALYAGDTAFQQRDLPTAAKWFAQAIQIDPDRETAYRYWGDAIMRLGNDPLAAKQKFIDAIVAEPYSKLAWQGLKQWATAENAILQAPKIDRPAPPAKDSNDKKGISITLDPNSANTPGATAWLGYSMSRALWMGEKFAKEFPDEKEYRHTFREESEALTSTAKIAQELKVNPDKMDESLRNLVELQKAGMIDCWILISGADTGVEQDYPAYRKEHRQLLHDYLARFVIHGGVSPPAN